jgi:carbamoyl-phosphate synthase small subunit
LDTGAVVRKNAVETVPGPNDADPLFADFHKMVEARKAGKI